MFISFYFVCTSVLALKKFARLAEEYEEDSREKLFGIEMFMLESYYTFLKYVHSNDEHQLILCTLVGGFFIILTIEIVLFIIIHALIQRENPEGKDYVVFWYAGYIFAEGMLVTLTLITLTLGRCMRVYRNVMNKKEEMVRLGFTKTEADRELCESDISKAEEDYSVTQGKTNERIDAIKKERQKNRERDNNYKSIYFPKRSGE